MNINYNLAGAVYRHSLATPDAPALACSGSVLSYQDFAQRAVNLAGMLRAGMPGPFDDQAPRVGILASRSLEACVAVIGASWAGATYVPISPKLPPDRVQRIFALSGLDALVTDHQGAKLLNPQLQSTCPPLVITPRSLNQNLTHGDRQWLDMESMPMCIIDEPPFASACQTAYIIFTSGTTGTPKGVMIDCGSIHHYARMIVQHLDIQPEDRALETCELSFDFSVHNMFSAWQAGASLHVLPASQTMNALKFAKASRITLWNSVPSLIGVLNQLKVLKPGELEGMRITVFGGEPLSDGVVNSWRSVAPNARIHNLYGPTEATVFCLGLNASPEATLTPGRDVVAIGKPLPGNQALVFDEHFAPAPPGVPGELAISGTQLFKGYLNAPELTAERTVLHADQRWYLTGDLALCDAEGIFHCLGRLDNQVKILGHRVELEEIDAHVRMVTQLDLVGSVAWPIVNGMAQGVVSFIGPTVHSADAMIAALKSRLPPYMVPQQVMVLDNIPLNASGKVDRRALRQLLEQDLS